MKTIISFLILILSFSTNNFSFMGKAFSENPKGEIFSIVFENPESVSEWRRTVYIEKEALYSYKIYIACLDPVDFMAAILNEAVVYVPNSKRLETYLESVWYRNYLKKIGKFDLAENITRICKTSILEVLQQERDRRGDDDNDSEIVLGTPRK